MERVNMIEDNTMIICDILTFDYNSIKRAGLCDIGIEIHNEEEILKMSADEFQAIPRINYIISEAVYGIAYPTMEIYFNSESNEFIMHPRGRISLDNAKAHYIKRCSNMQELNKRQCILDYVNLLCNSFDASVLSTSDINNIISKLNYILRRLS